MNMEKRVIVFQDIRFRKRVVALVATLLLFAFFNFIFFNFIGIPFSAVVITGHVVDDVGIVQIFVEKVLNIYIYSPENKSYDFDKGEAYLIALNVSADFNVDEWKYSLYDLVHDVYVEMDTPFTPNSSISAVRWGNLLTVYAHDVEGGWGSKNVTFFVNVSNSAPLIGNISDPIFVCEGEFMDYRINATDVDEDDLVGDISPKNPFYLDSIGRDVTVSFFEIISGTLMKEDVGVYSESISVIDTWDAIDSRDIDIDVIEINNVPVIGEIGAQTVWLTGEDSNFYHVVSANDVEDGVTENGTFKFNLTWGGNENLFDVGLNDGVMNYSPVVGHEGRVYSLRVCAEDNGLSVVHENISLCYPRSGDAEVICDDFSLTVTDENRPPEILNFSPNDSLLGGIGLQAIDYDVSVYDADGTIPDIDWFVDDKIVEHNENKSSDNFSYAFGCEVSGAHSVKVVTSDGLLNDSQEWFVSVVEVECPVLPSSSGGGGGGGGGGEFCVEDWLCDDWDVCQNVKRSFDSEILSLEDYSVARDICSQNKEEDERFCGFQITKCHDLNACDRVAPISPRPFEKRFCYFTENPGCTDGITNCHDGGCEVLVDCGGPCAACATCSDGKQNQGEVDIDCGGPCPFLCEPEVPFAMISSVLIVVATVLVIIISLILLRLWLLLRRRMKDKAAVKDQVGEKNQGAAKDAIVAKDKVL